MSAFTIHAGKTSLSRLLARVEAGEAIVITRERHAIREQPAEEKQALADIYEERGLKPKLAQQVAGQLMATNALDAHARDEFGFNEDSRPKPVQVAFASALAFSVGPAAPTLAAFLAPQGAVVKLVPALGVDFSRRASRAWRLDGRRPDGETGAETRLLGALAMAVTAGIGALIGKAV